MRARSNCLCPYRLPVGVVCRQPRRYLPYRLVNSGVPQNDRIRSPFARGDQLTLGYGGYTVAKTLMFSIRTAILPPSSACWLRQVNVTLRTLSRLMTRLLTAMSGWMAAGKYGVTPVKRWRGASGAKRHASITVQELVARKGVIRTSRYLPAWRKEDADAVASAMRATGITSLAAQRRCCPGGQRQRAIAMVLAQGNVHHAAG